MMLAVTVWVLGPGWPGTFRCSSHEPLFPSARFRLKVNRDSKVIQFWILFMSVR
jgi:hypothetical protein